jgi:MSHA biogenesis protein MshJ
MKQKWQDYSEKFLQFSIREQVLVAATGLIVIVFLLYLYVIAGTYNNLANKQLQNRHLIKETQDSENIIVELQKALTKHPDEELRKQIIKNQQKLEQVDQALLALTSKLVDPIQMRLALEQLLRMQKGVKLISFEVSAAKPLVLNKTINSPLDANSEQARANNIKLENNEQQTASLYRHTIKLKLSGSYFQLRNYLAQLETLPWKFFWEKFDYQLTKYPKSELIIEIYSLSLKQEFVGV